MRAHDPISTSRRTRSAWRILICLAVVGCALAVPVTASARPIDAPYVAQASQSAVPNPSQATLGRPNEGFVTPDHVRYTGAPLDTSQPVASTDAFDWGDAGLGAAAALGLCALAGAAVVIRRRTGRLSPSTS
jgi:hypothetical protein